jgi:hypothetical protein
MKDDEQRGGRSNGPRVKKPASPWRALVIGLLAVRALSLPGVSADSGVTVTVTTYRICFSHGCSHTRVSGTALGQTQKTVRMKR